MIGLDVAARRAVASTRRTSFAEAIDVLEALDADVRPLVYRRLADGNTTIVMTAALVFRAGWVWPIAPEVEARVTTSARAAGVPAPVVVGTGAVAGVPYMVYERLPGYASPAATALKEAVAALVCVHGADPSVFPRSSASRPRRLCRFADAIEAIPTFVRLQRREEARALVEAAAADSDAAATVGNHGDFRAANLLSVGRRLTGIVDWSDAVRGSRESDLGNVDPLHLDAALRAYEHTSGIRPDAALVRGYVLARHLALARRRAISAGAVHAATEVALERSLL